ncbi:MAG: serine/threonine-protein kinase [Gemmatimonadaceae bacterium]
MTGSIEPTSGPLAALLPAYEPIGFLGRGGMGQVWRARHVALDRDVAVKLVMDGASDPQLAREARLAAKVQSPHAVIVHDFIAAPDGTGFLIMELVSGRSLTDVINGGVVPVDQLLTWMREAAKGMIDITSVGIVHRDLKPSNLLIDESRLRVADFGIARHRHAAESTLTARGAFFGTPDYIAPEQAEDAHSADARSDIYSYGATFYHVATGEPPFKGPGPLSVLLAHKAQPLVSPRARRLDIPERISAVIERCMAKQPADRFQSFEEVLSALKPSETSPWDEVDPAERTYLERYHVARAALLEDGSDAELLRLTFADDRELVIRRGDLATSDADALVSSDDDRLSMGGGVSHWLNAHSGWVLGAQAAMYGKIRQGGVVVTGAGNLKARYVLHAVTIDYDAALALLRRPDGTVDVNVPLTSRDVILQLLNGCFYQAQTLRLESVAFPLLGTGAGGFSREIALDTMVAYLVRALSRGVHSVLRTEIVLRASG